MKSYLYVCFEIVLIVFVTVSPKRGHNILTNNNLNSNQANNCKVYKHYNYWFTTTKLLSQIKKGGGKKGIKKGGGNGSIKRLSTKMSKRSCRKLISRIGNFKGFYKVSKGKKDEISFITLGIPTSFITPQVKRTLINKIIVTLQPEYYILKVEKQNSTSNYHYHILAANITDYILTSIWYKWLRAVDILPSKEIKSLLDAKDLVMGKKIKSKDVEIVSNYMKKNPSKSGKEFQISGAHWTSSLNLKFGPLITSSTFKELKELDNGKRKVYSIVDLFDKELIGTCICNTPVTLDMINFYKQQRYFSK